MIPICGMSMMWEVLTLSKRLSLIPNCCLLMLRIFLLIQRVFSVMKEIPLLSQPMLILRNWCLPIKRVGMFDLSAISIIISDFLFETTVEGMDIFNYANKKLGLMEDLRDVVLSDGSSFSSSVLPRLSSTFCLYRNLLSTNLVRQGKTSTPNPLDDPHVLESVLNNKSFGDLLTVRFADNEILYRIIQEYPKVMTSHDVVVNPSK